MSISDWRVVKARTSKQSASWPISIIWAAIVTGELNRLVEGHRSFIVSFFSNIQSVVKIDIARPVMAYITRVNMQ